MWGPGRGGHGARGVDRVWGGRRVRLLHQEHGPAGPAAAAGEVTRRPSRAAADKAASAASDIVAAVGGRVV